MVDPTASAAGPLTLGTAGHIDHGKTTLVAALTGVAGDRLPEERARGMTITLGYAPLRLPSGRRLSVVDVPGHERFVRTMVAGATGIDLFCLVIAADDGVMPQTVEHVAVLRALGVRAGVVAVTKADVADPARAVAEARELVGDVEVVVCAPPAGRGVAEVAAALDRVAAGLPGREGDAGAAPVLHVDRAFTVDGRGTVVTGTLWRGTVAVADRLELLPGARPVRVRGLHVHDRALEAAGPGQRVALNLTGVRARDVARGDVVCAPGAVAERRVLDCALVLRDASHGQRVQVHHGTRHVPGRLAELSDGLWQLRLEAPVLAADGDHVVVRRHAPPDTLGGGTVLDAAAGRHGRRPEVVARLVALRDGEAAGGGGSAGEAAAPPGGEGGPTGGEAAVPSGGDGGASGGEAGPKGGGTVGEALPPAAAALLARLEAAGQALLSEAQLDDRDALRALRDAGLAVRVSGRLYADADTVTTVVARVLALVDAQGSASLAEVRDGLGASRKTAQAFLEHLDAARLTRRLADDRRVRRAER